MAVVVAAAVLSPSNTAITALPLALLNRRRTPLNPECELLLPPPPLRERECTLLLLDMCRSNGPTRRLE
jgi:hypothetical protein